jgi:hypothetical protein
MQDHRLGGKDMADTPENKAQMSPEVENPGRRRLLKFLAAGGTVAAVSMLPGKWSSPSLKTGVLPAHAQVTPGRYEVRCDPNYDIGEDEVGLIYYFSATAWDTLNNVAVPGISLTATINQVPSNVVGTAVTDGQGVANFQLTVNSQQLSSYATVTFTDQNVYGTDSCQVDFRQPA